jgi:hypothetical protein
VILKLNFEYGAVFILTWLFVRKMSQSVFLIRIRIRIGSAFDGLLDPHLMGSWIRIRIVNADPEGGNQPRKRRKIKSEDQKNCKNYIFYAIIF